MPGQTELTGLAVVAVAALACGILLTRLRQPAIVGYIIAGVLLGPSGLALVEDRSLIAALAELGVLMLLFVIGMELRLRALTRVWRLALIATGLQIAISVGVMMALSRLMGWSGALSILLGFIVAVSSTTVAIKILEDIGQLRSPAGRLAVGVLIAQDLAIVPMMLTLKKPAPLQTPTAMAQNKKAMSVGSFIAVRNRTMLSAPTMPSDSTMLVEMGMMMSVVTIETRTVAVAEPARVTTWRWQMR